MGLSRRKFTKEMKLAAVQQLEAGSTAAEVARAFEVNANMLHRWRKEFRHGPRNAFPGAGKRRWDETKVAQLERKVGQQAVEIDFLKGCLQRLEEQRMLQALTGRPRSIATSKTRSKRATKSGSCEPGGPVPLRSDGRNAGRRSGPSG
jgi:transposase